MICWPKYFYAGPFFLSHHSLVSVVTGLWDGQFQQYGLISDRGSGFHCCALGPTLDFIQPSKKWVLWEWSIQSVKLTTLFHWVPRLRMHGPVPPVPSVCFYGGDSVTWEKLHLEWNGMWLCYTCIINQLILLKSSKYHYFCYLFCGKFFCHISHYHWYPLFFYCGWHHSRMKPLAIISAYCVMVGITLPSAYVKEGHE
jgi:hypothetical protein